jgi:hypothetical protein
MVVKRSLLMLLFFSLSFGLLVDLRPAQSQAITKIFLPNTVMNLNTAAPIGFEIEPAFMLETVFQQSAQDMGASYVRLNSFSWRRIQPNNNRQFLWEAAAPFDAQFFAAQQAGLKAVVIVDDAPRWATQRPTACGALKREHFQSLANFMTQVIARYSQPPYNVKYWELGNEVDIDPSLVPIDNMFGCWGNQNDPYYGGGYYGEMLKVVAPAIRAADPEAKIVFGGLLLDSPNTPKTDPTRKGRSELFFEGALRAGAGPYFDILAFHSYPFWQYQRYLDHDLTHPKWKDLGGQMVGKVAFLRETMRRYNVDKPLWMNEGGMIYFGNNPPAPSAAFLENSAAHAARAFTRGLGVGVQQFFWFTLDAPGWNQGGLVERNGTIRPSFRVLRQLNRELKTARLPSTRINDYGPQVEAYRFYRPGELLDIIWSIDSTADTVSVPQWQYIGARDREGTPISPVLNGDNLEVSVGFDVVFLSRTLPRP